MLLKRLPLEYKFIECFQRTIQYYVSGAWKMCIPFAHVILLWNSYLKEAIEIHTYIMYKDVKYGFIYNNKDGTKCTH